MLPSIERPSSWSPTPLHGSRFSPRVFVCPITAKLFALLLGSRRMYEVSAFAPFPAKRHSGTWCTMSFCHNPPPYVHPDRCLLRLLIVAAAAFNTIARDRPPCARRAVAAVALLSSAAGMGTARTAAAPPPLVTSVDRPKVQLGASSTHARARRRLWSSSMERLSPASTSTFRSLPPSPSFPGLPTLAQYIMHEHASIADHNARRAAAKEINADVTRIRDYSAPC